MHFIHVYLYMPEPELIQYPNEPTHKWILTPRFLQLIFFLNSLHLMFLDVTEFIFKQTPLPFLTDILSSHFMCFKTIFGFKLKISGRIYVIVRLLQGVTFSGRWTISTNLTVKIEIQTSRIWHRTVGTFAITKRLIFATV